jgi:hypothetical protein
MARLLGVVDGASTDDLVADTPSLMRVERERLAACVA